MSRATVAETTMTDRGARHDVRGENQPFLDDYACRRVELRAGDNEKPAKNPWREKLIYTHIDLPLTAIADFAELGKSDPLFAALDEIVSRHNGLWCPEAERYLLAHAKEI